MKKITLLLLLGTMASLLSGCGSSADPTDYREFTQYDPNYNDSIGSSNQQSQPSSSWRSSGTRDALGHKAGPKNFTTVIIDPGHGGRDSGASVAGVQEKSLAMDISKRLKSELGRKFKVVFLRDGDYYVDLDKRVRATKPYNDAILVSIHLNHASKSYVRGPETYYFRVDSYSIAKRIQQALAAVSPVDKSRGLVRRRLRLTRNPEIPSVLVEVGYLSNSTERNLLRQSSYRQKCAEAMARAIKDQNKYGDQGMGKLPAPLNRPLSRPADRSQL